MKRVVLDIETNGLLEDGLDYSTMPYRLKETFKLWCIVLRDMDTNEVQTFTLEQCTKDNLQEALKDCVWLSGHNLVSFDLPVLWLMGVLEYRIGYPGEPSTIFGHDCYIEDCLLFSKLLNPDRFDKHGKHSLEAWGKRCGNFKQDFSDFSQYSETMLNYCVQDTSTSVSTSRKLWADRQDNAKGWENAYSMEVKLQDLALRYSLFGFHFDVNLAQECLKDLDEKMQTIRNKVNPLLPPRKPTKGEADRFEWPKRPFLKTAELASSAYKFAEKVGGVIEGTCADDAYLVFEGKRYSFKERPKIEVQFPADIDDLEHLKAYLISLGWEASEFKERDLTKRPDKIKKTRQELEDTVYRYVKQTFSGYFAKERCELIGVKCDENALTLHLMNQLKKDKPVWVPVSPKLNVGVEKLLCPGLERLGEQAEFVKDVVQYLTYKHRRNSILGGGAEYSEEDEYEENAKGWLSCVREDGRIGTPVDTLGASTSRMRLKQVVNVPRCSSLYGEQMRALFKPGKGYWIYGFDFSSAENFMTAHFIKPYSNGDELAKAFMAEKPHDLHTLNSKKLGIDRSLAKSLTYGILFGAQAKKISKMLGVSETQGEDMVHAFWDSNTALREFKERLEKHWEQQNKTRIKAIDGRFLMARSKHSLLNLAIQGNTASFVKWSTVLIAKRLEDAGFLGDCLLHDKHAKKVFQICVNQDEIQHACHPALLDVKTYTSDDEAKQLQQEVANCSSIGHGKKGTYMGLPTEMTELIYQGIKDAEEVYKLRVNMKIEWAVGDSWASSH